MWQKWRKVFAWSSLCPVLFADPAGLVVVMRRASQPVTQAEVDSLPDYYPGITAEPKVEDYGRLINAVVAVDYGLPYADAVNKRRAYYETKRPGPAMVIPR